MIKTIYNDQNILEKAYSVLNNGERKNHVIENKNVALSHVENQHQNIVNYTFRR